MEWLAQHGVAVMALFIAPALIWLGRMSARMDRAEAIHVSHAKLLEEHSARMESLAQSAGKTDLALEQIAESQERIAGVFERVDDRLRKIEVRCAVYTMGGSGRHERLEENP